MSASAGAGNWLLIQELFERGNPSFVDELRRFDDADVLGAFAARWFADNRPEARRLLLEYLDRPLNAYRHEALVKRLFKLAEAAGDDAVMARMLVALDRSIRRSARKRVRFQSLDVATREEAEKLADAWRSQGLAHPWIVAELGNRFRVSAHWHEACLVTPTETAMPRGTLQVTYDPNSWNSRMRSYATFAVPDWVFALGLDPLKYRDGGSIPDTKRKVLETRRLFSVPTRHYLRRRAWRYFRKLGRFRPERYIPAVRQALTLYRDEDAQDVLALLDNWGLIHILFAHSPCLRAKRRGWHLAEGHSLDELEPAPRFAALWREAPRVLVDLLLQARGRAVRAWALRMIRSNRAAVLPVFPVDERIRLLHHEDPEVVQFAVELLRGDDALRTVPLERWLGLVETGSPEIIAILSELIAESVNADHVSLGQAARLASVRVLPVARLGMKWLEGKTPRDRDECEAVLRLGEAECEVLRPELIRWAAAVLSGSELFRPEWVLEWLDSRHRDVRDQGWTWFLGEPRASEDIHLWQRLMETPYDDVRVAIVQELEARAGSTEAIRVARGDLNPELLRFLWASVLLNVVRGNRAKPVVVRDVLKRIEARPAELPQLLPLLAVALRSVRGPEWRAGLAAVVRLAEYDAASEALIRQAFPELQLV